MPMLNFQPLPAPADYASSLLRLLKVVEGPHPSPKDVGDGKITIGLGFNLNADRDERRAVVEFLLGTPTGTGSQAQRDLESGYRDSLIATIIDTTLTVNQRIVKLNSTMAERAGKAELNGYVDARRATFAFSGDLPTLNAEVDELFNLTIRPLYERRLRNHFPAIAQGAGFVNGLDGSRELVVLMSLLYNGGEKLVGGKLRNAIVTGNRAEAWFQIRYDSNGGTNQTVALGLAKRRFLESELFGLYSSPSAATLQEAQDAYRMLTMHRVEILVQESRFGETPDGVEGVWLDSLGRTALEAAQGDYATVFNLLGDNAINTLVQNLVPAQTHFLEWVNSQLPAGEAPITGAMITHPAAIYLDPGRYTPVATVDPNNNATLDALSFDSFGVEVNQDNLMHGDAGDDVLYGAGGNDILFGGAGADTLYGGKGTDRLYGGDGYDSYVIDLRDGVSTDRIVDSAGGGRILIIGHDGQILNTAVFNRDGTQNAWVDPDGIVTISHNSPWRLTLSDGSVIELGENFDPAGFGMTLQEEAAAQTATYTGDFLKQTNVEGTGYVIGADGNYVGNGAQADAADVINGSAGADSLQGLGGNDGLSGGAGDDMIEGGAGNDVLQGGRGADELDGGDGNDMIYGSSSGSLYYPNDTAYQRAGSSEPVVLGLGFTWLLTSSGPDADGIEQVFLSFNVYRDQQAGDAGNIIDAGAGQDCVDAGTGADVVHGGDDADDIVGMAGNDVLFGDAGNDRIHGDGPDFVPPGVINVTQTLGALHGADIIDGGAGNDLLIGQGGADVLYGGIGDNKLWGDDRNTTNGTDHQGAMSGGKGTFNLAAGRSFPHRTWDATLSRGSYHQDAR